MTIRRPRLAAALASFAMVVGACASAPESAQVDAADSDHYPVQVSSCGFTSTITDTPGRAVTLNQGATEVMLALGLEDHLAATAYLDDDIPARWKKAYGSVEVLSPEYPDHESLLAAKPDFVYASYASAFGTDVAGPQSELEELGIGSLLSLFGCGENKPSEDVSFDAVWKEVGLIGEVFNVSDRADQVRTEQSQQLAALAETQAGVGVDVFWFDSGDTTAFAGAGEGGPQLILDAVGATNIFADVEGGWADVSWERVVAADPDVIVLADAGWSSASDKIDLLRKDPVLSKLTAVRQERFVILPFSETTPGVRLVDGAQAVADGLAALDLD